MLWDWNRMRVLMQQKGPGKTGGLDISNLKTDQRE
jgi:hypothetical protein